MHVLVCDRHLCSEEDFEVLVVGQYGMLRDLVEEAVQRFPPGLNKVIVEAFHHAFHYKLLRQWLRTQPDTNSGLVCVQGRHAILNIKNCMYECVYD